MSREFGSYSSGYFHQQIETCAEDALEGRDKLTNLWGEFLKEFYHVAYEISNSEACDSGPDASIIETIKRMHTLQLKLTNIANYVEPYDRVAKAAIEEELKKANQN